MAVLQVINDFPLLHFFGQIPVLCKSQSQQGLYGY